MYSNEPNQGSKIRGLGDLPKEGRISRIMNDGFGYVEADENDSRQYIFSLRAIPNYHGESVKELNLRRGTKVRFRASDSKIQSLAIGPDYSGFLRKRGILYFDE